MRAAGWFHKSLAEMAEWQGETVQGEILECIVTAISGFLPLARTMEFLGRAEAAQAVQPAVMSDLVRAGLEQEVKGDS